MIDKLTAINEHQHPASGIKHWDLSGYLCVLPRINFCNGGYGRSPYSPTFHTRKRCQQ